MKKTYFIIFYIGVNYQGTVHGYVALEYENEFPNRLESEKYIIENYGIIKCVITNLIKITKSEYDEWCRK